MEVNPAKIKKYLDYMWGFENFCLATRPNMFAAPSDEDMAEIREVHKWLSALAGASNEDTKT